MPYDHYNNKIPNKTRKQVESFTSNKTLLSLQESCIKYKFPELSIDVCVSVSHAEMLCVVYKKIVLNFDTPW